MLVEIKPKQLNTFASKKDLDAFKQAIAQNNVEQFIEKGSVANKGGS